MSEGSKILTELDFLAALERGEVITQMTLSKRISVSIGLNNALLRRTIHKGFVKAKAAPYKRYAYYLTPKGFSEKSRLVARYLRRDYLVLAAIGRSRRYARRIDTMLALRLPNYLFLDWSKTRVVDH